VFLKVVAKGIARDFEGKQRLQPFYEQFVAGCEEKGIPKKSYDLLWDQILQMSTYSFNKAHSSGYSLEGYQDKYLKKHYPFELYVNLLSIKPDKIPNIIRESKVYGVNILPPDINTSDEFFVIDGNSIRFGLLGIKNVGPAAIEEIKLKRPFKSFDDLMERTEKSKVKSNVRMALFKSGALDSLGGRTNWSFDEDGETRIGVPVAIETMTEWERETMGFAISKGDDITKYRAIIDERITLDEELVDGEEAFLAGEVINVKEITTKSKEKMAFVELEYLNNTHNLTVFPKMYSKNSHLLVEGAALLAIGDWDEERKSLVAEHLTTAAQLAQELERKR
jgi:DNA polymerase-3 subunit alpha